MERNYVKWFDNTNICVKPVAIEAKNKIYYTDFKGLYKICVIEKEWQEK